MKSMRRTKYVEKRIWVIMLLLGLTSIALGGCHTDFVIPEQDIVFDQGTFGQDAKFGLVNADGSNLEYLEFHQPSRQWAKFPVWSPDKTKIVYLMTLNVIGGSGDLLWMDVGQKKVQDVCSSSEAKAWRIDDRPRWTPDGKWWVAVTFDRGIGLISPKTCEIQEVLIPRSEDEFLRSPDLSVSNELVFERVLWEEARPAYAHASLGHIMIRDLNTGTMRELGRGMFPSWSPDGEWVVFTKEDGLYVMHKNGSGERRLLQVDPWWNIEHATLEPLRASWSPDGNWVVYSKRVYRDEAYHQDIYKLNIDTGEEIKLVENGLNPHWYWPPKPIVGRTQ